MTVMAGRKGSKETAEWFADAIKPGSAIGCSTIDPMPKKLNFAFKGNMSFSQGGQTYSGKDIVIAQGHTGDDHNNWWIGGPNMAVMASIPPFASSEAQTFNYKDKGLPLSAKVTFSATMTDVYTVHVGIISL